MTAFGDLVKTVNSNREPVDEILGIGGSPRKNGNSDRLLSTVLSGVKEKGTVSSSFQLRDIDFTGCIGCEKCRKDKICTGLCDGMSILYQKVLSARGLVLACPTHNYNITAWMKAFIDRLYCFYDFDNNRPRGWSSRLAGQGRKAVIIGICEQEKEVDMGFTMDAMKIPLEALGYEIVGEMAIFGIFDRGGVEKESATINRAMKLGTKLAENLLS